MHLTRLEVKGFRSLRCTSLDFDRLTMLIGANDSGKSSILDMLDIALNNKKPDQNDFYSSIDGQTVNEIEVILQFVLEPERDTEAAQYALDVVLKIRVVYSIDGMQSYYWGERPEDERLQQDFDKISANDQTELIHSLEVTASPELRGQVATLRNKPERAQWLREYLTVAPKQADWIPLARLTGLLPRFERYSTMDYNAPENIVLKTLRQVYEDVIYEDIEENGRKTRRFVKPLRDVQEQAQEQIQNKVQDLLEYIKRYNSHIHNISFDPSIDFSGGLRAGQFQIDDGRGVLVYLSKTGDGTKRRMFMATLDWDREVTLGQNATTMPSIIRGYDEPDTNLDYDAQRLMYRSISDIVMAENSRTQAIICSHSPCLIDRAPAQSIRLLRLDNGCTRVERLETQNDAAVESFLKDLARELGLTNTLMFYECCFLLIEGETEENALPILYRRLYGHSLLEDGIRIINVHSNGAFKEFFKLLSHNRKELTIILADSDTEHSTEERLLRKEILRYSGFDGKFIDERIFYIGDQEFEDAFSDHAIAQCLQLEWPKDDGEWQSENIRSIRSNSKFSSALQGLVWGNTKSQSRWSKPIFGTVLGNHCDEDEIPRKIQELFKLAREVANCT